MFSPTLSQGWPSHKTGHRIVLVFFAVWLLAWPAICRSSGTASIAWGVCGHPTFSDYQNWNASARTEQIGLLQDLGCDIYRCSFEYSPKPYPALMDNIVPVAQAAGVLVLPVLPVTSLGANGSTIYADVYAENYTIATTWANYAISKGYKLPYWELGNEMENWGLVNISGDGSSPSQYTDKATNGFERIRAALNGAYDGLKAAYSAARQSGLTTITPSLLSPGTAYRHWGLLTKIKNANGTQPVPWDILSWHWYTPSYGDFSSTITDASSPSYGKSPVQCLNEFPQKSNPAAPMDIWITECGRSQNIPGSGFVGGSATSRTNPAASQDWALQAQELEDEIADLATVPTVKAIIVYELFDETSLYAGKSAGAQAEQAYFGLVTGLGGTRKDVYYVFRSIIEDYDLQIAAGGLISFHWGSRVQTGAAVLGQAGDQWGASMLASQPVPQVLSNVYSQQTSVRMTWAASSLADQQVSQYWNPYDAATAALMMSYLSSYQYTSTGSGAIVSSLSGLVPNRVYDLVLYGAGLYDGSTPFSVSGGITVTGGVAGTSRKLSDGAGVAYVTLKIMSSATGTIEIRTTKTGGNVYLNGFQLVPDTATPLFIFP